MQHVLPQVGDMEEDHSYWGRPEDIAASGMRRPAFLVNATHPGSDVAAQAAAALAATATVRTWRELVCLGDGIVKCAAPASAGLRIRHVIRGDVAYCPDACPAPVVLHAEVGGLGLPPPATGVRGRGPGVRRARAGPFAAAVRVCGRAPRRVCGQRARHGRRVPFAGPP
jgi:hypothetical protein